jgi:hypothetical protein
MEREKDSEKERAREREREGLRDGEIEARLTECLRPGGPWNHPQYCNRGVGQLWRNGERIEGRGREKIEEES